MMSKLYNLNEPGAPRDANGRKIGVGYGYNVLEYEYINPTCIEVVNPILDLDQVEIKNDEVDIDHVSKHLIVVESALSELSTNVNVQLGLKVEYLLFSGKLEAEFDTAKKTKQKSIYSKSLHSFHYKRKFIQRSSYIKHLNKEFLSDLRSLDIKRLFARYGTHLIVDAYYGGRIEINYSFTGFDEESKTKVKVAVDASYKGISGSAAVEVSEESKALLEKSVAKVLTVGGSSQPFSDAKDFSADYKEWAKSISDEKYWDCCYLPNDNSLVPIWELCDADARREEIRKCFESLATEKGIGVSKLDDINTAITDIMVLSDKNEATAKSFCPKGYTLIDKNLNESARKGSNFIFLCYKRGGEEKPIGKLFIQSSKTALPGASEYFDHQGQHVVYKRLPQNLNQGAGGDFCYLCMSTDRIFTGIKKLEVVFNEQALPGDWMDACWYNDKPANISTVGNTKIYIKFQR